MAHRPRRSGRRPRRRRRLRPTTSAATVRTRGVLRSRGSAGMTASWREHTLIERNRRPTPVGSLRPGIGHASASRILHAALTERCQARHTALTEPCHDSSPHGGGRPAARGRPPNHSHRTTATWSGVGAGTRRAAGRRRPPAPASLRRGGGPRSRAACPRRCRGSKPCETSRVRL